MNPTTDSDYTRMMFQKLKDIVLDCLCDDQISPVDIHRVIKEAIEENKKYHLTHVDRSDTLARAMLGFTPASHYLTEDDNKVGTTL